MRQNRTSHNDYSELSCDVLVFGATTSGVAAAIQAGRMGSKVIVIAEEDWLGGMYTSAGVSAFDGNNGSLGTGIYREIRSSIESYYGSSGGTSTGWISETCFEPHIAEGILEKKMKSLPSVKVFRSYNLERVLGDRHKIVGALFNNGSGEELYIESKVTIDASEFGDLISMAGVPYVSGRESRYQTGEPHAQPKPDNIVQDLTYVATLQDYHKEVDLPFEVPDYDESMFSCCCAEACSHPRSGMRLYTAREFMNYGRLPNDKYMLNWPIKGNDLAGDYLDRSKRQQVIEKAKWKTLCFLHFIREKMGFRSVSLALDEYQTQDHMPYTPYVRESIRIVGAETFREQYITKSSGYDAIKGSVAIGHYWIDHHHSDPVTGEPLADESYPGLEETRPFQIPVGVLIPAYTNGLLAAEKNIASTHLSNGVARLQPVVTQIGQAAGALAVLSVKMGLEPRDVPAKVLQNVLIDAGCAVYPYYNAPPEHLRFQTIQRLTASRLLNTTGNVVPFSRNVADDEKSLISEAIRSSGGDPLLSKLNPDYLKLQQSKNIEELLEAIPARA
ncbi:MAG: FAD-dependent oxidoreductase [Thermoprotei archaeon]